jgi:NDP-sugar pyrophosphorylase family protein
VQVAILAGGRATRMGGLAERTPKFLLRVGGRPFADLQLGWLAGAGVERVVLCIGHLGDRIREFAGDGSRWGLEIAYVDEGQDLRGTGGALRLAHSEGALEPRFGVLYGDSYLRFDIADAWRSFDAAGVSMLMCVLRNAGRWDASNAAVAGGRVTRYEKGVPDPAAAGLDHIDYGFQILDRDSTVELIEPGATADLSDPYGALAERGEVAAYEVRERFYEIGSPEGLAELEAHLAAGSAAEGP